MYHGSSSAACSGGNITLSLGGTSWSTLAVSTRVGVAGDEVVAPGKLLSDVHPALECGEAFMEPVRFHTMFNPLEHIVFFVDVGSDRSARHFEFGPSLVVAAVSLHLCEGGRVLESTCRFSQGVVGPSPGLEEFEEPVGEGGSGAL